MEYDRAGNIIPLFNHLQKHSQPALEPETLQTIDDQCTISWQKPYETIHEEQTLQMGLQVLVSMWL